VRQRSSASGGRLHGGVTAGSAALQGYKVEMCRARFALMFRRIMRCFDLTASEMCARMAQMHSPWGMRPPLASQSLGGRGRRSKREEASLVAYQQMHLARLSLSYSIHLFPLPPLLHRALGDHPHAAALPVFLHLLLQIGAVPVESLPVHSRGHPLRCSELRLHVLGVDLDITTPPECMRAPAQCLTRKWTTLAPLALRPSSTMPSTARRRWALRATRTKRNLMRTSWWLQLNAASRTLPAFYAHHTTFPGRSPP
jgi:hypothetical protein